MFPKCSASNIIGQSVLQQVLCKVTVNFKSMVDNMERAWTLQRTASEKKYKIAICTCKCIRYVICFFCSGQAGRESTGITSLQVNVNRQRPFSQICRRTTSCRK